MAFLQTTTQPQSVVVPASGTSIAPGLQVAENTHTVVVFNPAAAGDVYFNWTEGAGVALTKASSHVVGPGSSLTLGIGTRSERAGGADVETQLSFDCDPAANGVSVRLSYLNAQQS